MSKPIRVFYSELDARFYASQHYRQEGDYVVITGKKYDVTDDIGAAIRKHDIGFIELDDLLPDSQT